MKKHIYILSLIAAGILPLTSCSDFLETSSPSVVDSDLVFSNIETARAAMDGAYENWRSCANSQVFGAGLFYGADMTGSDIERHPEPFTNQTGRHYPECLYQNGTYAGSYGLLSYLTEEGAYAQLYSIISRANAIINAMEEEVTADIAAGNVTDMTQLYGEAVALRATAYRELLRNFGDVPYQVQSGVPANGLSPRDFIYDKCLADLVRVEPVMYRLGENTTVQKNFFSRNYVQGLIGRMALEAGGYHTRRLDLGTDFYTDGEGNQLTFETLGTDNNDAQYGRRTDWKDYYELAQTYFKKCIDNPGTATFHETDPRGEGKNGQMYENPYQYFFQQMNNLEFADESIYEYAMTQGIGNSERPYALGRVSSGGSSKAYPCKSYGQGRINPAFYYGMFSPNDKRRDVSACVTGSDGKGNEKLIPLVPNSKADGGGITVNKWDENRMASPYTAGQRKSGINGPYMRLSEIYLGYAEACAALGEDTEARAYLDRIRNRAFPDGQANTDEFIAECGSLLKAVIQERGFEYAGEGDRRWTLIRTGMLPEAIRNIKEMTKAMMDGLRANGYYQFANGNVISSYVWTKMVDARSEIGYRLTTECPADEKDNPIMYPGWRGQNDSWEDYGCNYGTETPATNVAIKGLFEHIDPNGSEAQALEAEGYTRIDWGKTLVDNYDEYYTYLFYDYDYVKAPIYLWPFTPNVLSTGGFTNGYGFQQK